MKTDSGTEGSRLTLVGRLDSAEFDVLIEDRTILESIRRFPAPDVAIASLLQIGACAALATATGFDSQAVRQELDRAVDEATEAVEALREHVVASVSEQGPLAVALNKAAGELSASLRETLDRQVDPEDPASFVTRLRLVVKQIDDLLATTRRTIAEDLARTAKEQSDNVGRALKDMRDLDPASALGRALSQLDGRMVDLTSAVNASQHVALERRRGTAKGHDYEDFVAVEVASIATVYRDRTEQTGSQQGKAIGKRGAALRGDVTCWLDDDVAVVIEAMDRKKERLTHKLVRVELEEAMANRGASAAIAVMSSAEGTLMCGQPLQPIASNMWAVHLPHDGSNVLALQVAYQLAREAAKIVAAGEPDSLDVEALKTGVEDLNRKLSSLARVKQQIDNIASCQEKASSELVRFEREMRDSIFRLLNCLATQIIHDAA